jgi:hypothetical protein
VKLKAAETTKDEEALLRYEEDLKMVDLRQSEAAYAAWVEAARQRINLSSRVAARRPNDLRQEERIAIMREIMNTLSSGIPIITGNISEVLAQVFDFDEVFYFVAPDWWAPRIVIRPQQDLGADPDPADALTLETSSATWGDTINPGHYFITDESEAASMGASIGWLLQLDGDDQRNAFLNSPMVKVLVPIRPGAEAEALKWLTLVEGKDGAPSAADLAETIAELENSHDNEHKRSQAVYKSGYAPLGDSFTVTPERKDGVFSQWTEIVPTDQVAAVEIEYE